MRIKVPLLAYAAAALAGAAVFAGLSTVINQEPVSFDLLIYALPALFIIGAVVAAPVAAPTIIITERRRSGPFWVFLAAGLVAGFAILGVLTYFTGWASKGLILIPAPTTAASLTYWLVAWHWFAPKDTVEAERKVFE
ncbi:MAG: hypothetical protein AAFZ11_15040 [Pseudomonadota bacterium]